MARRRGKSRFARYIPLIAVAAIMVAMFSNFFPSAPATSLRIVSGSENKALEPIIHEWARASGNSVEVTYLGSVDISRELSLGKVGRFDAVWPANSLWIELGDDQKVVKHAESILRSPVVLGLKRAIAERLGWVGRTDITIQDIRAAAERGDFRLAMTSATQSNSGASAYFGFLYAMAGDPDVLRLEDLESEPVREATRALLGTVDRSSGSSGWLKEAFVENPDRFDAMMNYEALVIEANRAFVQRREEPLYIVYPANGLAVADSPLGYVDKGDAEKEEAFLALQQHLLSADVQNQLVALGRRAGLLGLDVARADRAVWNPDWGVDLSRAIAPIPTPNQAVIRRALTLYQTELRKPSLTIWVLDVSGSMQGAPIDELREAMRLLLDEREAERNLLQPSPRDVTVVIPFNNRPQAVWIVEGDDPAALNGLWQKVRGLQAGGGTDVYLALIEAVEVLSRYEQQGNLFERLPAIVAMTDGESETANRNAFVTALGRTSFGRDVPVHAIAFGNANESQLRELAQLSVGRLFKSKSDLAQTLRSAKGYN
ncbi:MAG: substrate-binding and VWA domain-containing protein [Neomegalonema sp.]|nr:substrate-binding and VWA domain-containing protein [Neomegalonema sp.]